MSSSFPKKKSNKKRKLNSGRSLTVREPSTNSDVIATYPKPMKFWPYLAPERICVKCLYLDIDTPFLTLTSGLGVPFATKQYKANDIFDPNPSVGSSSSLGLQMWNSIYTRFRVHKVKATITGESPFPANSVYLSVWLLGGIGTTAGPTSWSQARLAGSQKNAREVMLAGSNGGPNVKTIKVSHDLGKLYGDRIGYAAEQQTSGFTGGGSYSGASPSYPFYLNIMASTTDGSDWPASAHMGVQVKLEQWVEFFQPVQDYAV